MPSSDDGGEGILLKVLDAYVINSGYLISKMASLDDYSLLFGSA